MSFGIDYSASDSSIIPEGIYEAVVKSAYEDVTRNGKTYIAIPLIIRNDVEQPYKNAIVWHKLWKRKDPSPSDLACGGYSVGQISAISKAVKIPDKTQFKDLEDWFEQIIGQPMKIAVKYDGEYNGRPNVSVAKVEPSANPDCKHTFREQPQSFAEAGTEVEDDDIVF